MPSGFLEVHVPISPRPFFLHRVRYLAKSIRMLGGPFSSTRIIVTVGDAEPPIDLDALAPWARDEAIEWRWIAPEQYLRWHGDPFPYMGTMMARFGAAPFDSEFVMMADADVIVVRDFLPVLAALRGRCAIGGVMAHVSPFIEPFSQMPESAPHAEWWARMFAAFDLPPPHLAYPHPGFGHMYTDVAAQLSPAYFNSGVVIGTGQAMTKVAPYAISAIEAVRSVCKLSFCDQIAFTLMMYKAGIEIDVLPLRYNFPNIPGFETRFASEFRELAILHYLRAEIVHRDRAFRSEETIAALLGRKDLTGGNEVLRSRVAAVHDALTGVSS